MTLKHHLLAFTLTGLVIIPLNAEVTYIDASVAGNTTLADGTALVSGVHYTTANAADGMWATRGFGNNDGTAASAYVLTSNDVGGENAPRLRTTISTGLTIGESYEVFAYFWGAGSNNLWRGRVSLTNDVGELPGYNTVHFEGSSFLPMTAVTSVSRGDAENLDTLSTADGSGFENGGYFSNSVLTEESDRRLYQVSLGSVVVDGTGSINVYIDELADTSTPNRTWYDGVGFGITTPPTPGEITYVDASSSNVTRWDGQPFNPAPEGNTTIDDNWEERSFGNSGGIYESNADGPEDAPLLVTTLTGLTPDTDYVLYAYFWHDGRDWRLKASAKSTDINDNDTPENLEDDFLPSSPLTSFSSVGNGGRTATEAPAAQGSDFVTSPLLAEGNRRLRQASLGRITSDGSGSISVYIDDLAGASEANRVWFDGIGYKEAQELDPATDEDGDTLANSEEASAGTDPYLVDTDGDSYSDAVEIAASSDPLDPNSIPPLPGNAIAIAPDGVWTWFNDERAIWHLGKLYSGYVLSDGQYGITQYDPTTNTSSHTIISTGTSREKDDHNNPSITVLPDNKLLIVYSKHTSEDFFYHRTSLVTEPSSLADWSDEVQVDTSPGTNGGNNTYANTYRLSGESDQIYLFHRQINFNPTITTSSDNGATWGTPTHFINTGGGGTRPYPRYCSNNIDRIDLIYTDGHPRDVNNSVYHMYYSNGEFLKTDGTLIDTFANLPLEHDGGQRGTIVYPYTTAAWGAGEGPDNWIPNGRGWTWDIHYGSDGDPVCVFQVQLDNVTGSGWNHDRIYYYYARWNGSSWQRRFIAQGGRGIYSAEDDYGGGMCIDPDNPNVVYISSNAAAPFDLSDINNVPLGANERYEIYRGVTHDGGLTFDWETITEDSQNDNLRPIVPANHDYDKHVVWFNGDYTSYVNFNAAVVGIFSNDLTLMDTTWTPSGATFTWASTPGASYDITSSLDLQNFNIDVLKDIPSQGSLTTQSFDIPPAAVSQGSGFFRVEERP